MRTRACGDGRRGEAADARERHGALVVDADVVRAGAAGEQLAEADGLGLEQPRQLRAARLVGLPRRAPVHHVRQAVRHVEHRVHARRADPARRRRRPAGDICAAAIPIATTTATATAATAVCSRTVNAIALSLLISRCSQDRREGKQKAQMQMVCVCAGTQESPAYIQRDETSTTAILYAPG